MGEIGVEKTWVVVYRHTGNTFVLYVNAETLEEAIEQFRSSLLRLSPILRVELETANID